jgi:hypothetical protein
MIDNCLVYSDEILLILPVETGVALEIMNGLPARIRAYGEKLVIKPSKSSLIKYETKGENGEQSFTRIDGKGQNGLEYLGFRYDGRNVFLRDATIANLYRKVAKTANNQARAAVKRYAGKTYEELCEMFDFEQFSNRFGRAESFEQTTLYKQWTFWTYVKRSVEEFGPLGTKIHHQVSRLRRRSKKRVDATLMEIIQKQSRENLDDVFDVVEE